MCMAACSLPDFSSLPTRDCPLEITCCIACPDPSSGSRFLWLPIAIVTIHFSSLTHSPFISPTKKGDYTTAGVRLVGIEPTLQHRQCYVLDHHTLAAWWAV